jgi:hypothetical protein
MVGHTSHKILWMLLVTTGLCAGANVTVKLGLIQPLNGSYGFQQTASAISMAVADIRAKGLLNGVDIQ